VTHRRTTGAALAPLEHYELHRTAPDAGFDRFDRFDRFDGFDRFDRFDVRFTLKSHPERTKSEEERTEGTTDMRTRPAQRIARVLGWIAVAVMLCLTSPGVRVVRADEPAPVSELPAGPACSELQLGTAVLSVALPSEQEAERRAEQRERPRVVPLDGGGNRYGSPAPPAAPAPTAD
jgi:hypothetical protein